ncbi:MAG: aromatic amino acid transport family protein [Desulfonatronovibrio sp.]
MNTDKSENESGSAHNDLSWILTLFGTAVGAGILYLPLQAGLASIWALIFLSVLVCPLIYFSHKNILLLLVSAKKSQDYSGIAAHSFGNIFGFVIVVIFLVTFYAVLFSYAVGLNANLGAYLVDLELTRSNWAEGPFLSLLIMLFFAFLHLIGKKTILRVMSAVSLFLIVFLVSISVYLIPFWDLSAFRRAPSLFSFVDDVLLVLPILTFSFVFFPAMSSMVAFFRKQEAILGENTQSRLEGIVLKASVLLLLFVLLFVYSCIFSLTADEFEYAIRENLNCLTILSSKQGISPVLASVGSLVGIAALFTSFVGVLFAVRDSAFEFTVNIAAYFGLKNRILNNRKITDYLILGFIFTTLWIITAVNPSVIQIFGVFIAPLVALFLFILPVVILIKKNGFQVLKQPSCLFVLLTGILILFSYELGTLFKIHHI